MDPPKSIPVNFQYKQPVLAHPMDFPKISKIYKLQTSSILSLNVLHLFLRSPKLCNSGSLHQFSSWNLKVLLSSVWVAAIWGFLGGSFLGKAQTAAEVGL